MTTPTEFNEYVRFVEQNDPGVVAQMIEETHTPNEELDRLAKKWLDLGADKRLAQVKSPGENARGLQLEECAGELGELIE